jgi:nitrobenzene nitroreductase
MSLGYADDRIPENNMELPKLELNEFVSFLDH